ncbi:phage baseplate assembly protein domain-containing protein [Acinetobacter nectaris]|uniref:phage baseplate assembly protein domain-containing protein n=1 Tax=Acinetobacter nectaris TaxID=1219382 RepID=UPI001F4203FD|nr:phage baseplate assembly protein [Acinetobacter nectaris]MCF8999300.1 phage baseplate assembly protein [Acinetobacter nectaris]MCF9028093.1 phage baseplate assembly protein [Acinetobacter nectaris]
MIHTVRHQIGKAKTQVRQSFLGIVARAGSSVLQLKGFADEVLQEIENYQQIGFSSHIPKDAKVVLLPLQGKTSRSVVIATKGGAITVDVASGETCIYDQFGHSVWLKKDGTHIKGDLFVDGQVKDKTGTMQQIREVYNGHNHGNSPSPNQKMEG